MRLALLVAVFLAAPLGAAETRPDSVQEDPARDQAYIVDTAGRVDGPCHAPAADLRRLTVDVANSWISVKVDVEDLDDRSIRCNAVGLGWDEPEFRMGLHGICVVEFQVSCSTPPGSPSVEFFAERHGHTWFWITIVTRADMFAGHCYFGFEEGEDSLEWRLPVAHNGDGEACDGFHYTLEGAALTPAGLAISWGDRVVPAEDTVVGPRLTIEG